MAEVILLEKIFSLGELGQQVTVRNGYARNYLIPYGKAVIANKETVAQFAARRAELEKLAQEQLAAAQVRAEALSQVVLIIPVKAAERGRLYGSVGSQEIVQAAAAVGCSLEKNEIRLPEGALRELGEHEVTVQLHNDVIKTLKINIVSET